jgi:hypothetical protein
VSAAQVDLVNLHKDTLKGIRLWERDAAGHIDNPLEGTAVQLTPGMVILATTGAATLRQGTAQPLLLVGEDPAVPLLPAAAACFTAAQLNWSSPMVAQHLPLPVKRTDEDLQARAAQEIRHWR